MALLGWTERMLRNNSKQVAEPMWAVWKLNSRLDRKGFGLHLLAVIACGSLMTLLPAMAAPMVLLMVSAMLRRLRDLGQGVPVLILLVVLSRVLPVVPLILVSLPGDKLPNRYGPVPGKAADLEGGLQAALRRMNG